MTTDIDPGTPDVALKGREARSATRTALTDRQRQAVASTSGLLHRRTGASLRTATMSV
jgi:hypothetical protein